MLKSPIIFGKSNIGNHNFCNVKEFHDTTLKELKPVVIETIFRNGRNPEEISNGIRKLLEGCNENLKVNEVKSTVKLSRNLNNNQNIIQDFSYPFKQDNFTCKIF